VARKPVRASRITFTEPALYCLSRMNLFKARGKTRLALCANDFDPLSELFQRSSRLITVS
jgi:hypothetical protein